MKTFPNKTDRLSNSSGANKNERLDYKNYEICSGQIYGHDKRNPDKKLMPHDLCILERLPNTMSNSASHQELSNNRLKKQILLLKKQQQWHKKINK